jgi:uncharacterized protein (DUF433 family)
MIKQYVETRDGGYWIAGSRVSLDSVVCSFLSGQSAESIAQSFPVLTLEQVYGAIAFYLCNRLDIDAYLAQGKRDYDAMRQAARDADPHVLPKIGRCPPDRSDTQSMKIRFQADADLNQIIVR